MPPCTSNRDTEPPSSPHAINLESHENRIAMQFPIPGVFTYRDEIALFESGESSHRAIPRPFHQVAARYLPSGE
jgi:hypothetical protein